MPMLPKSLRLLTFLLLGIYLSGCFAREEVFDIKPSASSQFPLREWSKLPQATKVGVITSTIEMFRESGTQIDLPPTYYVTELDEMRRMYVETRNENGLDTSVGIVFRAIAIMEGDWGTGESKVEQLRQVLGPAMFEEFKIRDPDRYRHLVELDGRNGVASDE